MKKWHKNLLSVIAIILVAAILLFVGYITLTIAFFAVMEITDPLFYRPEVYRGSSSDNEYVLVIKQIGSPGWPYGPVKAQIKVLNANEKKLDKETVLVYTDGTDLWPEYHVGEIRWGENTLEIDFNGEKPFTQVMEWIN